MELYCRGSGESAKLPHVKQVIDETNKWLLNENIDGENYKKLVKNYFQRAK